MKTTITGLLLMISLFCFTAKAQSQLTFTLQGAVDHALQYNKTLINSELAVDKSRQGVKAAIANGLPQVNAKVDYSNALGAEMELRFNENLPASKIPIKPSSNFNIQLTQILFSGSYIVGVQTARLYKELSETNLQKSVSDIKTQVTDSYYLVLVSEELLTKLEQNLINLKDLYKKTEALASVGIIEQTDVDQLFVQVNSMQTAVNALQRQLELATNMLRLQLGVSIDTQLALTDKLDKLLDITAIENTMLQTLRLESNLDYQMMDQQVNISRKMVDMKKSAALPSIAGYYSYTYKLMKPEFDMSPANILGLQMNIPVFSSGLRNAQTKQAFIDLKTMQNNRDLVSDQLNIQSKQLKFNLSNALETYNNHKSNIEVSRRVYTSLKLKYEQGLISGLDLITADNNYLRAETELISSTLELLEARLQLEKMYTNITK